MKLIAFFVYWDNEETSSDMTNILLGMRWENQDIVRQRVSN